MATKDLRKLAELRYLGITEEEIKSKSVNPFRHRTKFDIGNPEYHLFSLMSNPDYFYWTCNTLINGPNGKPLDLHPFQCVILKELWYHKFPMLIGSRGLGKSFILALYALLRALFVQGSKVVITGSGFRQSKTVFNYAETMWNNSPLLRSMVAEHAQSGPHHDTDRWWMRLGDSVVTCLPIGDGTRIRGERANVILCDEFASVPQEIFETVISGFGAVELDPIRKVKERAYMDIAKEHGQWSEKDESLYKLTNLGNQTIISGTAYYQFNHFASYWKRWHGIVSSCGDRKMLAELFGNNVPENFAWEDYAIMRLPVEILPEGFMDKRQIDRARATMHAGIYTNEYAAVFSSDSNGFFKRSLVESCVTNDSDPIVIGGEPIVFRANTRGREDRKYIYGIDPASEHDRFSIVVLEVHPDHRRVVYCWTTTRQDHTTRMQSGLQTERDFYGFCARKIRDLMKVFPCEHIAIDSQGGGYAVMEALHDPDKLDKGENLLWPITPDHPLSDGKDRDSDRQPGLHILEPISFADAKWTAEANHGLRKDMEDKVLIFPMYDPIVLASAMEDDNAKGRVFDTLEDATKEVEDIKDELSTIIHTQTPGTMRDRWDTPETKLAGSKKGRLRKDRYSALLMANASARRLTRQLEDPEYVPMGGFAVNFLNKGDKGSDQMYTHAPAWFRQALDNHKMQGYGWVGRDHGVD